MLKEVKKSDNSFGIASVILGILSIVFSFTVIIGAFGGVILGIIGLVFAIIQRKSSNNKWAFTGIILSSVGILIGIIFAYIILGTFIDLLQQLEQLQSAGAIPTN